MTLASGMICAGCGFVVPDGEAYPFRCPNAGRGDGADHVLALDIDWEAEDWLSIFLDPEENPFVRYRKLMHVYRVARARGVSDADFVAMVRRLDAAVREVDGRGFQVTPFAPAEALSRHLGFDLWVKDETGNVAGSHKARHLMGLALWLEIAERGVSPRRPLAIASCGNAALAAAVVARAAGRPLEVFIPPGANPRVVERLEALGARLTRCPRDGRTPGDPCVHRFHEAVARGALPFACQGNENGLTIEGGKTLAYEMVSVLVREPRPLDRLFVQVGGGALASSVIQGLRDAQELGLLARLPRIHAVQTAGASPLARAHARVVAGGGDPGPALRYAAAHRSEFMWPWEEEPRSIAAGILDDETYDWLAVVRGMLETGGHPIVVSEDDLREAHALARASTGIPVDPTGSAGLAGCLEIGPLPGERVAVLFTGIER